MQGRRRVKKRSTKSYGRYLKRVLYQLTEDGSMTLSKESIQVLDSMMDDIFNRISTQASQLVYSRNRKTLTPRDMDFAVRLIIPGDLGDHSTNEGQRALLKLSEPLRRPRGSRSSTPDSLVYSAFQSNVRFHSSVAEGPSTSSSSSPQTPHSISSP